MFYILQNLSKVYVCSRVLKNTLSTFLHVALIFSGAAFFPTHPSLQ